MARRMVALIKTRFQTGINYTGGMDNCTALATVIEGHHGFVAPCCSFGSSWSSQLTCGAQAFTR
jgi:hypothetical protein